MRTTLLLPLLTLGSWVSAGDARLNTLSAGHAATQCIENPDKPAPGTFAPDDPLVVKARRMAETGGLVTAAAFAAMVSLPQPAVIELAEPSARPLRGREIAEFAAQGYVLAGWLYHCSKCGRWHAKLAGGYAIAKDTVATAFHVMLPPDTMKEGEGNPIVVRGADELLPVTGVLLGEEKLDAVVLRLATADLKPLALSGGARAGDAAYCLSDPHGVRGYFSAGMVNRLYSLNPRTPYDVRSQRLNVSSDWAPGSSGSAVLDECANVIGHVARIQAVLSERQGVAGGHESRPPSTYMTMHEAVPAKSLLGLIRKMNLGAR